jgi:hypothetical protein
MVSGSLCWRRAVQCCGDIPRSSAQRGRACGEGEARSFWQLVSRGLWLAVCTNPRPPSTFTSKRPQASNRPRANCSFLTAAGRIQGWHQHAWRPQRAQKRGAMAHRRRRPSSRPTWRRTAAAKIRPGECVRAPGVKSRHTGPPRTVPRCCLFPPELTPGARTDQHAIPPSCLARSGAHNPRRKEKEDGECGRRHPRPNSGRAPTQGRTRTSTHTHTCLSHLRGRGKLSKTVVEGLVPLERASDSLGFLTGETWMPVSMASACAHLCEPRLRVCGLIAGFPLTSWRARASARGSARLRVTHHCRASAVLWPGRRRAAPGDALLLQPEGKRPGAAGAAGV